MEATAQMVKLLPVLRHFQSRILTFVSGSGGMIPSTGPPFAMTRWVAQTRQNYVSGELIVFHRNL